MRMLAVVVLLTVAATVPGCTWIGEPERQGVGFVADVLDVVKLDGAGPGASLVVAGVETADVLERRLGSPTVRAPVTPEGGRAAAAAIGAKIGRIEAVMNTVAGVLPSLGWLGALVAGVIAVLKNRKATDAIDTTVEVGERVKPLFDDVRADVQAAQVDGKVELVEVLAIVAKYRGQVGLVAQAASSLRGLGSAIQAAYRARKAS